MNEQFVLLMFNTQGLVVAVGDDHGQTFASAEEGEKVREAYMAMYPGVHSVILPLQSSARDVRDA